MLSPPDRRAHRPTPTSALGVFGIATRMVQRGRRAGADAPAAEAGERDHGLPAEPTDAAPRRTTPSGAGRARGRLADVDGERHPIDKRVVVLGRSQDCDIQLADPNVSRRHAELRQEETSYWIVDLGSTNGMEVNGRRLRQSKLEDGDRITLG